MNTKPIDTIPKIVNDSAFNLKNYGPGLLTASAAIGGSHLIASTTAGAIFGWQLVVIILLANLLKYPFFRFSVDYTYDAGHSLVEGYARKNRMYLLIFTLLASISAVINTSALAMLSAAILKNMFTINLGLPILASLLLGSCWLFSVFGRFKLLDGVTKFIVISLTLCTMIAVAIAVSKPTVIQPDFVSPSPWNLASIAFLIALMGWMPAPIEVSAINSMWITAKESENPVSKQTALRDFNVGYIGTAVLAIFFLALGALVLHGNGQEVAKGGFKFVPQLISTYSSTIGEWSTMLVSFIAFICIYGTTITIVDGYGRVLGESQRLLTYKKSMTHIDLMLAVSFIVVSSFVVIFYFAGQLKDMLGFAMILAFLAAPVFAWLNFSLVRKQNNTSSLLVSLAWVGMAFLSVFTIVFIAWKFHMIG